MVSKRRILIIDDEPMACYELSAMLQSRHLDFEVVASVNSTAKAWEILQNHQDIEGLFLDIDIQTESKRAGLDFGLNLSRMTIKPWIVFVTGYREFAVEAFQAFPVNYLLKPVDNAAIERTLDWIRNHCPQPKSKRLTIRHRRSHPTGEKFYCNEYVELEEILYIQKNSGSNTVKIALATGEILDGVHNTLKEWEALGFFQIHRRNLINLQHVRRQVPRIGENNVYKLMFKNCSVELDIGPDFLTLLHEKLKCLS